METQNLINYNRVAEAISFIKANFKQQPSLEEIADKINLSPFHFQRLFTEWAGVSPKKFIQYLSIEHAKSILHGNHSIADASFETGLSGSSRLHDLFVSIEGMTPGEYKNGGEQLSINFSFAESPFGQLLVASTSKGICYMSFIENEQDAFESLCLNFPNASYHQKVDLLQKHALYIFRQDWSDLRKIKLHVKGTPFQLKVWATLLKVPVGALTTYSSVAKNIDNAAACRAVGTAIGSNPIAFLIPCHRVIKSVGGFGHYHWGSTRKQAIIGWEAAKVNSSMN